MYAWVQRLGRLALIVVSVLLDSHWHFWARCGCGAEQTATLR